MAEATAVQVNSDIFFLSDDGIRSLIRSAADDFTSVGLPISEVVKDVIQSINTAAIGVCTAHQINKYSGYKSPAQVTTADYQDAGVDYESYVRTKDFNFGDPFSAKYGSHFEVIFDDSYSTDASISIQRDIDVGDIDVQPNLNISSAALTLPFTLPAILPTSVKKRLASDLRAYEKWRLLNIKITSAANKMAVRQITAAANPDTIEVQKSI
ncbi:MAG: hypothetical protein EBR82_86955 [Caulobacteraceae bacterium]|nr:hypothetical protein [Caulobacteraceae bacterium]